MWKERKNGLEGAGILAWEIGGLTPICVVSHRFVWSHPTAPVGLVGTFETISSVILQVRKQAGIQECQAQAYKAG